MKRNLLACFLASCYYLPGEVFAQPATYTFEVFNANIPYPAAPTANRRVTTLDWLQNKVSGTAGAPNDFQWVNTGANPVANNQNIAGFPAGAGFVRYINRTIAYPGGTSGVNFAANGDAALLITRALDFSGHTVFNAIPDTLGLSIWRDNSAGPINVLDYVEVYLNTTPDLTGAVLLATPTGSTRIHRSSTQLPVAAIVGWNRYQFRIPNLPQFVSATGGSSSVYIIVKGVSAGGNNIFLDNFQMPQWTTTMAIQSADLIYQEDANVAKNSTNNLLLGVKVTTKGSTAALRLDAATFLAAGSSNWLNDVTAPASYFTGGTPYFATTLGAVSMPVIATGPGVGLMNFGWWSAGCPVPLTPATMTLNPGSENYVWFAVNVSATATSGNYIGANFQFATARPAGICTFYGNGISSTNLTTNPILGQTSGKARLIAATASIPYYIFGTSFNSYTTNDFISAVDLPGVNGTAIDNWYHDNVVGAPCTINCDRFATNPSSYTSFPAANAAGLHKKRMVQVLAGAGKRSITAPYLLRVAPGTAAANNAIRVFIDWNNDGDFDDTYNGAGGLITETLANTTLLAGNMATPFTGAFGTWAIDVPTLPDFVTDLNDPTQLPNNSVGPLFTGLVRMRIREAYGIPAINPFFSGYPYGETEDYFIQVLDNCPSPSLNVCKWIGTTSDWNDRTNWCPDVPTINDMAYIGLVNTAVFSYPAIKDNTNAVCRQLKIMDNGAGTGAQVLIDAAQNGLLTVADDIIIGQNAPAAGTAARISVKSNYQATQTIPGKSMAPPAGVALVPQTPFRTNAQSKTQIAYTATELATTYGWQAGDVIDQISIEVNSISGGAGPSNFQNFRIRAFLTTAPVTFPFPPPPSTKIAVEAGDANVVAGWPKIIWGTGALTLIMPQGTNGTQAGGNYYTFNLIPSTLVWDGVSNLVLSFENHTAAGLAPAKNYVLYDELNTQFTVLSVNGAAVSAGPITGFSIDGAGHYSGGVNAAITATASNIRPRLDFTRHRQYGRFDITVGGKFINNNSMVRSTPYGITPVYGIPGDSGFVAGYSKVSFNPTNRPFVNSPGFGPLWVANMWNPLPTSATLAIDIDQEITSANNASTVFNQLEINKVSASGRVVRQSSTTATLMGAYADSLALTNGEFYLNRKTFTLQNAAGAYVTRTNGWIRSEDNLAPAGNTQSIFKWKIGTNTSAHSIPFGKSSAMVFPFVYTGATGDVGDLSVATYSTAVDNTPYPAAPDLVNDMNSAPPAPLDCTPWTVDRFWYVKRTTATAITGTMRFEYDATEGTGLAAYSAGNMRAQTTDTTGLNAASPAPEWMAPYAGQTDGINAANRYVQHPVQYVTNTNFTTWAIVSLANAQPPLYGDACGAAPVTAFPITGAAVDTIGQIYTYSVPAVTGASGYKWTMTTNTGGGDILLNGISVPTWLGTITTATPTVTIQVHCFSAGWYTHLQNITFRVEAMGPAPCNLSGGIVSASFTLFKATPTAIPITGSAVDTAGLIYTYSVPAVAGATGYRWTMTTNTGGGGIYLNGISVPTWLGTITTATPTVTIGVTCFEAQWYYTHLQNVTFHVEAIGPAPCNLSGGIVSASFTLFKATPTAIPITGSAVDTAGLIYTYSVPAVAGASGYKWTMTTNTGGGGIYLNGISVPTWLGTITTATPTVTIGVTCFEAQWYYTHLQNVTFHVEAIGPAPCNLSGGIVSASFTLFKATPTAIPITGSAVDTAGLIYTYSVPAVAGATGYRWTMTTNTGGGDIYLNGISVPTWLGTITTATPTVTIGVTCFEAQWYYTHLQNVTFHVEAIGPAPCNLSGGTVSASFTLFKATPTAIPITGSAVDTAGLIYTYSVPAVTGATGYRWTMTTNTGGGGIYLNGISVPTWLGTITTATPTVTIGVTCFEAQWYYTHLQNVTFHVEAIGPAPCNLSGGTVSASFTLFKATPTAIPITGSAVDTAGLIYTYSVPAVTGATGYRWTMTTNTGGGGIYLNGISVPTWLGTITTATPTVTIGVTCFEAQWYYTHLQNVTFHVEAIGPAPCNLSGGIVSSSFQLFKYPTTASTITGLNAVLTATNYGYSVTPVTGASGYRWTSSDPGILINGSSPPCNNCANNVTVNVPSGYSGTPIFKLYITPIGPAPCNIISTRVDSIAITVTNWSPLPIELLSFTASAVDNKEVLCKWTTATEINNDYFTIEKSRDGEYFEETGTVDGAGNSTAAIHYSFTDEHPYTGVSYYRLKQTDFDGAYSYSEMVPVRFGQTKFTVYPNPASDQVFVFFTGAEAAAYTIKVFDATGRAVLSKKGTAEKENLLNLNTSLFSKGIYSVQLITDENIEQAKIVIQ